MSIEQDQWGVIYDETAKDEILTQQWKENRGEFDRKTIAKVGGPWARTLDQYLEILTHSGAPNALNYAQKLPSNLTIVDAGSAGGIALSSLREFFPEASLHAVDFRYSPSFTLKFEDDSSKKAAEIFKKNNIIFHQESFLKLPDIIPQGYDLLFCVGRFFYPSEPGALQYHSLQIFWQGLKKQGLAEITMNIFPDNLEKINRLLENQDINHKFYPGIQGILAKHSLNYEDSLNGIMVLGPK